MLFLMGGNNKKAKAAKPNENLEKVKELFNTGRFPVVTTNELDDNRKVDRVLGLVACRGFDSEEAFFGMCYRAINQGAQAIIGYQEQVAFHPDGSKYFSCYGTAVQFEQSAERLEQQRVAREMHRTLSVRT